jgi:hypothetical protein
MGFGEVCNKIIEGSDRKASGISSFILPTSVGGIFLYTHISAVHTLPTAQTKGMVKKYMCECMLNGVKMVKSCYGYALQQELRNIFGITSEEQVRELLPLYTKHTRQ